MGTCWIRNRKRKQKIIYLTDSYKQKHREILCKEYKRIKAGKKGSRTQYGYARAYYLDHPYVWKNKMMPLHILVYEYFTGMFLQDRKKVVHHKNFNKLDNRFKNLELRDRDEHSRFHIKKRRGKIKKIYDDEYFLYKYYVIEGYSAKRIADMCGCSDFPIRKRINKLNLKNGKKLYKERGFYNKFLEDIIYGEDKGWWTIMR